MAFCSLTKYNDNPPTIRLYTKSVTFLPHSTLYWLTSCFNRTFATGVACWQWTLTPPDTWSRPIWDLHICSTCWDQSFSRTCRYFSGLCTSNIPWHFSILLWKSCSFEKKNYVFILSTQVFILMGNYSYKNSININSTSYNVFFNWTPGTSCSVYQEAHLNPSTQFLSFLCKSLLGLKSCSNPECNVRNKLLIWLHNACN